MYWVGDEAACTGAESGNVARVRRVPPPPSQAPAHATSAQPIIGFGKPDPQQHTQTSIVQIQLYRTEAQKEQLFAFCDTDCSGVISEKEFQEGWDMMLEVLLENVADSLGLSKAQIIMAWVYILTILVLLVFFILLTIGAWNNESSFNALVQGTLISGAGKAVTALRQKSKAEDGESLEGLVDQILDGQKDAAAEAE